jgi:hypothetical protein
MALTSLQLQQGELRLPIPAAGAPWAASLLPHLRNLQCLCSGRSSTPLGAVPLGAVLRHHCPELQELRVAFVAAGQDSWGSEQLQGLGQLARVTLVDVCTGRGDQLLAELAACSRLQALDIRLPQPAPGQQRQDQGLQDLKAGREQLGRTRFSAAGLSALGAGACSKELRRLAIDTAGGYSYSLPELQQLLQAFGPSCSLESLDLPMDDGALQQQAELLQQLLRQGAKVQVSQPGPAPAPAAADAGSAAVQPEGLQQAAVEPLELLRSQLATPGNSPAQQLLALRRLSAISLPGQALESAATWRLLASLPVLLHLALGSISVTTGVAAPLLRTLQLSGQMHLQLEQQLADDAADPLQPGQPGTRQRMPPGPLQVLLPQLRYLQAGFPSWPQLAAAVLGHSHIKVLLANLAPSIINRSMAAPQGAAGCRALQPAALRLPSLRKLELSGLCEAQPDAVLASLLQCRQLQELAVTLGQPMAGGAAGAGAGPASPAHRLPPGQLPACSWLCSPGAPPSASPARRATPGTVPSQGHGHFTGAALHIAASLPLKRLVLADSDSSWAFGLGDLRCLLEGKLGRFHSLQLPVSELADEQSLWALARGAREGAAGAAESSEQAQQGREERKASEAEQDRRPEADQAAGAAAAADPAGSPACQPQAWAPLAAQQKKPAGSPAWCSPLRRADQSSPGSPQQLQLSSRPADGPDRRAVAACWRAAAAAAPPGTPLELTRLLSVQQLDLPSTRLNSAQAFAALASLPKLQQLRLASIHVVLEQQQALQRLVCLTSAGDVRIRVASEQAGPDGSATWALPQLQQLACGPVSLVGLAASLRGHAKLRQLRASTAGQAPEQWPAGGQLLGSLAALQQLQLSDMALTNPDALVADVAGCSELQQLELRLRAPDAAGSSGGRLNGSRAAGIGRALSKLLMLTSSGSSSSSGRVTSGGLLVLSWGACRGSLWSVVLDTAGAYGFSEGELLQLSRCCYEDMRLERLLVPAQAAGGGGAAGGSAGAPAGGTGVVETVDLMRDRLRSSGVPSGTRS